jgi:elongation factor 2
VKEKTLEGCIQSVTEIMKGFGVSNIVEMHVKNDAINILTSTSPVSDSVRFGFQQACISGPLAEEPVRGVVWRLESASLSSDHPSSASYAVYTACRASMLASPVRVSEPMLSLEIQTGEIKATQSVLATRRANIFHSDLVEGSYSEYVIKALLPASEAFRLGDKSKLTFSDELRGATHGKVVWRLSFSHWAVVGSDSPLTMGISNKLVCNVRKRKGLTVGEKVVDDPDKQRTLTKMK